MTGPLDYVTAQGFDTLLVLLWYVVVFEVPRYLVLFALTALVPARRRPSVPGAAPRRVSVVVVGHSEGAKVETCVRALREQSRPPDEIVVLSDGSTDSMPRRALRLAREGLIAQAHVTELRGGKAAGLNLGGRVAKGDVVVFVDCDCTFDRHALRAVLRPFDDPEVGAVAGSVLVRNARANLLTRLQAIEYLVTISLGKRAMDRLGLVSCVSGAFGAFRRAAYQEVGGYDAEGGEDLDITLSLRARGWRVAFAADAVCYTDVPTSWGALARQRGRWERDAIRLRFRKHGAMMNPFAPGFSWSEWLHEAEFLLFNVVAAALLPVYLVWLSVALGAAGWTVLLAAQLVLLCMDFAVLALAAAATPRARALPLALYLPAFGAYYGLFMRALRLCAYAQEWVFRASRRDEFVPRKVQSARGEG